MEYFRNFITVTRQPRVIQPQEPIIVEEERIVEEPEQTVENNNSEGEQMSVPTDPIPILHSVLKLFVKKNYEKVAVEIRSQTQVMLLVCNCEKLLKRYCSLLPAFEKDKKFERKGSPFSVEMQNMKKLLAEIKEDIEAIIQSIKETENMDKMNALEARKCCIKSGTFIEGVLKQLKNRFAVINNDLPALNEKLYKRILEYQRRNNLHKKIVRILSINAHLSWEEAFQNLEDSSDENVSRKINEICEISALFNDNRKEGMDFVPADVILNVLGINKEVPVWKNKLIDCCEWLPVIMLEYQEEIIMIDSEALISSPDKMLAVFQFLDSDIVKGIEANQESILEAEAEIPISDICSGEKKKKGSKRSIHSQHPEWVEAARKFCQESGVAAHPRRHEEVGEFGFSMRSLQKHFIDNVLKNGEKGPSLETLR